MKHIISRTLEQTLKLITIILAVGTGGVGGYLLTNIYIGNRVFNSYMETLLVLQHCMVFFMIAGVILICTIASNSTGLIASEAHEGTLRLLVAKPNSRVEILLGKVIGSFIAYVILLVIGLASFASFTLLNNHIDGNIINELFVYYPGYLLYGLIVALFYSSLSTLLSCIVKKKITALLPVFVVFIAMVGFFPLLRLISDLRMVNYGDSLMYLVDINYHFGAIFTYCMNLCGNFTFSNSGMELLTLAYNGFSRLAIDTDIIREGYGGFMYYPASYLPQGVVVAAYSGLSVFNYALAFMIMRKKNV